MTESTLKIALLDDEKESLSIIEGSLSTFFNSKKIAVEIKCFASPVLFLNSLQTLHFDLLLCDIEMPEIDGIEVAQRFRKKDKNGDIIFLSNREDRVFDSLKVHPFGFIRKKSFLSDVNQVLTSYLEHRGHVADIECVVIENGKQLLNLPIAEITYIESEKKIQHVHFHDGNVIDLTRSMKLFEDLLSDKGFISTHKAYLVNYRYIRAIADGYVELTTGEKVLLSRRKEEEARLRYLDLIQVKAPVILS